MDLVWGNSCKSDFRYEAASIRSVAIPSHGSPYNYETAINQFYIGATLFHFFSNRSPKPFLISLPPFVRRRYFLVLSLVVSAASTSVRCIAPAVGALLDPRRADLIAALGETTGKPAFQSVLERMKRSPEGRAVLLERPRVISAKVGHAWDLPPNTFGAAYARFMGSRNFSPDDCPPVRFMDTDELAYVAMRAREVHDFWHTLFDLPTNLIGESALKVIEFKQLHLPMCVLSVIGGTARFNEKQRSMQCSDLMCVYYEQHFDEDLEDIRRKWGIVPAPAPPKKNVRDQ